MTHSTHIHLDCEKDKNRKQKTNKNFPGNGDDMGFSNHLEVITFEIMCTNIIRTNSTLRVGLKLD